MAYHSKERISIMNKILMLVLLFMTIASAEIINGRYTDEFGDPTGDPYIMIHGIITGTYAKMGAIMVSDDKSVSYRTNAFIGSSNKNSTVMLRDNAGNNLTLYGNRGNAGSDVTTWTFNSTSSQQILAMFKSAIWVKIVVRDYQGDAVVAQISANGVTAALNNL